MRHSLEGLSSTHSGSTKLSWFDILEQSENCRSATRHPHLGLTLDFLILISVATMRRSSNSIPKILTGLEAFRPYPQLGH